MKRFIYTAVAGAVMVTTSSNMAMAGRDDDRLVLMCKESGRRNKPILVKVKNILKHLAKGDILGGCRVPTNEPPVEEPE